MHEKIEISHQTIINLLGLVFALWLVTKIWPLLIILFVSFIIMSALKPAVKLFEKLKISRALSIVLVYLIVWLLIGALIAGIIPPLVVQTSRLISTIPAFLGNLQFLNLHQADITTQLISLIGTLPENVLKVVADVFGNLVNLFTTLVISFYLLTERENLDGFLNKWLGKKNSQKISGLVGNIESSLGGWVRGELLLMLVIGLFSYIGLRILGVDTALPLSILAGLFEIIPGIGPILSAIPAVIFAFSINPLVALSTVALYFLIHNLENSFITPLVMRQATGVNPLISLLSLIIGFELAGAVGTILAIPALLAITAIVSEYMVPLHKE
jgi:predicted PurR-regulated permease PerM